jgi:hypothetical protein
MAIDYNKKFEELEMVRQTMPDQFEMPEHISKSLLDIDTYNSPVVNLDSARANLNKFELRQVRADGSLLLELEEAEQTCGWDLGSQKSKTHGIIGMFNVTSRSKNGWSSVLAKTDKHINIQQTEQFAEDIDSEFSEQTQQGLSERVRSRLPFLKRREM